jgi:tetratricopeptide (TPR) repeat protein
MSKRFLLCLIVLAALGILAVWWVYQNEKAPSLPPTTDKELYEFEVKQGLVPPPVQSAPKAIPWKETIRLAVGGLGCPDETQDRQLGDLIAAQLSSSRGLELVERQELDAVLKEQELNLSGLVRAEEAVRVGRLLRADWFLLGTISQVNGTNSLVMRLVDARTGILCDGAVFVQKSMPALAAEVADFVGQARQAAAEAKPRVYLAIGTFEDLSVNSRQADFATQLRGYLMAAYQHSRFTLLEREYAQILYQEMELDLAGLTEGSATNAPAPIQSAFWLVDGYYQSYETTNAEVEVTLDVNRMFSRPKEVTMRELPGEPACRKIKQAIDGILDKPAGLVIPTRISEARVQMDAGKSLAGLGSSGPEDSGFIGNLGATESNYQELDEQQAAVQRHNFEEAIRAFDTVLLLEPKNRAAKFYLAFCYRNQTIGRVDEARNLYREILEELVQDNWSALAGRALVDSFLFSSPQEKTQWFEKALHNTTNSALEQFYQQNAETAERDAAIQSGEGDTTKLVEQRLLEAIRSCKNAMEGKPGTDDFVFGLSGFRHAFQDKAVAARKMVEFLPQMESKFPELAPHLTAAVLTFQTDTNSPVVAEFQKQLEWCETHPKELYLPDRFWSYSGNEVFNWLYNHKLYQLAVQTIEGWQAPADQKIIADDPFANDKRIALGYAYMKVGRWQAAMEIFDSFSNMPVCLFGNWPWGNGDVPVLTGVEANYCREKLGLPVARDSREFEMDKTAIELCSCSPFAVDGNGLWIGADDRLIHLDFNLETNLEVILPKDPSTPVTAICVSPSKLWIGTGGDGLIEFDKVTRQCRRLTIQDGLMMNEVSCAQLSGNRLWIGYGPPVPPGVEMVLGQSGSGGIGFLDLSSYQFVSFTPSLTNGTEVFKSTSGNVYIEPPNQPPRREVRALAARTTGDVWFLTEESALRHFQQASNTWDVAYPVRDGRCPATDTEDLYFGEFNFGWVGKPGPPGLMTFNFRDGQWHNFKAVPELPTDAVTAISPDDGKVWIGGTGYIALIDPKHDKLCNFTYIRSRTVDRIQIGGNYLWAQYNGYLHRAALSNMQ